MSNTNKTAFIDIDNTLWQFCDVFYEELKKINKDFPTRENWTHFNIWEGFCTEQQFFDAINSIHQRQDSHEFLPYPEAKGFLGTLKEHGYRITIASHRSPDFMPQTERWLKKHGLIYDEIHLSYHKIQLINRETTVVVDDSPNVLERAVKYGAMATGLLFPWNVDYRNNGFRLCRNLNEILEGILADE
jgi:hypothetical protein